MKPRSAALLLLLVLSGSCARAQDQEIVGAATVVDGNTMIIAGERLRLFGSDAPDPGQQCTFGQRPFPCGDVARTALMDLVAGAEVRCRLRQRPDKGPRPARCVVLEADVAANMVHTGWAVANRAEVPGFASIEDKARKAKRGLWRGTFEPPAAWRRKNRNP